MNLLKTAWMRFNLNRSIDVKMNSNFYKIRMLRLCNNFPSIIEHRNNLNYWMINVEIDKTCRKFNDKIKKNCSLNKFWSKFWIDSSKFNSVLKIFKIHINKIVFIMSHFSKMLMCVKWVNRYFIVFFMLVIRRFMFSWKSSSV